MGFAAAVSVPDGVAVASDGRVQARVSEGPPTVVSDTHQSIVPLTNFVGALVTTPFVDRADGPPLSVRSMLERVRPDFVPTDKLNEILPRLGGILQGVLRESDIPQDQGIDLRLIGYSQEERAVQVVLFDGLQDSRLLHSTREPGIDWFGWVEIATRLVKGHSMIAPGEDHDSTVREFLFPAPLMSIEDALDLAETLVRTTATFAKFVQGVLLPDKTTASVVIPAGGRIHSAVVTPSGFKWALKPEWVSEVPSPRRELGPT